MCISKINIYVLTDIILMLLIDWGATVRIDVEYVLQSLEKPQKCKLSLGLFCNPIPNPTIYPKHYPLYPHLQWLQWITVKSLLGHSTWKLPLSWFAECIQNDLDTFWSNQSNFMDDNKFLNLSNPPYRLLYIYIYIYIRPGSETGTDDGKFSGLHWYSKYATNHGVFLNIPSGAGCCENRSF